MIFRKIDNLDVRFRSVLKTIFDNFVGTWNTPGFPKPYLDLINCNVSVSAPEGYVIELTFANFSLESKGTER